MPSLPARHPAHRRSHTYRRLLPIILLLFSPVPVLAQGSGAASTGTGGNHIIQGKIFFPSGRRAEGSIQIKLQSFSAGEISTMADSSGSFTFASLAPGNYVGVINARDDYEIGRESVNIDRQLNLSRTGIPLNSAAPRDPFMSKLQPKPDSGKRGRSA